MRAQRGGDAVEIEPGVDDVVGVIGGYLVVVEENGVVIARNARCCAMDLPFPLPVAPLPVGESNSSTAPGSSPRSFAARTTASVLSWMVPGG